MLRYEWAHFPKALVSYLKHEDYQYEPSGYFTVASGHTYHLWDCALRCQTPQKILVAMARTSLHTSEPRH